MIIFLRATIAQHGVFCYAGCRTYPHQHIANQVQSQLNEHNRALEYHQLSIFGQQQYWAEVTRNISTAESPEHCAACY